MRAILIALAIAAVCNASLHSNASLDLLNLPPLPSWYNQSLLPIGKPSAGPPYMVDNVGDTHGVAPDKGSLDGPITNAAHQLDLMALNHNQTQSPQSHDVKRQDSDFWYSGIAHGIMPFAPDGYAAFRNVKDFGAVGDGTTDDTVAINRAASWLSESNSQQRCGEQCGQTTRTGATVYFPPGTYLVSSPIIQYYFTRFIGDANSKPTILGSANFSGIALIDCDPYIPNGNGSEWYINQNQFFRQIRNFVFDLTKMPWENTDEGQEYAPTGIHWQVAQATSLQYLDFQMPLSDSRGSTPAVGIFMENGSGGFLSDLYFYGGGIGFRAGSQQYTARNLRFDLTLTAISMIWDWGFTWQNLTVNACYVAIDCTSLGGIGNQGSGSITVLDSTFSSVPYPIVLRNGGPDPNIILDNVLVENSASVVLVSGGETILPGSQDPLYFDSWGLGRRYTSLSGEGEMATGFIDPPVQKPVSLLDGSQNYFSRSKPTYANYATGDFVVATDHGISNGADGDQSAAINNLLSSNVGKPIYFPSGIYLVANTIEIPIGSIIVGELWPQIMATGDYFSDENNPQVMVRVGNIGDTGVIEISDMLFTVQGPTRGAILVEWNAHESTQGSAAMWDSHFRVGGAYGTNLTRENCPKGSQINRDCMAAQMLMHVTSTASGYFENVWLWTADHDMDVPTPGGVPTTTDAQLNIYSGRGLLIESQGPCWFYGTSSEHHQIYQYQVTNAKNILMTHIQTETPYYQPSPDASEPYQLGQFYGDPLFQECASGSSCLMAWALRVIESQDILIYTAGLYSFFSSYSQDCVDPEDCQEQLVETSYTSGFWLYNIFTKGAVQMITPRGGIATLLQSVNQLGYTTEVSAWLALALGGGNLGGDGGSPEDGSGIVSIDPEIYLTPSPTVQCFPPCTMVLPPSSIPTDTTLSFEPVQTSLVIGGSTITQIPVPTNEVTVSIISFSQITISTSETTSTFALETSIEIPPVAVTGGSGSVVSITLPAQSSPLMTSSESVTTLPTTTTEINGTLYTFSLGQFPDLSSLQTSTVKTTTLSNEQSTQSSSSPPMTTTASSTAIIVPPFSIAPGGFYWSPVYPPEATLPPFVFPRLPEFPKIPDPKCFRFGDLFSIDCPPDKGNPTTHYTSGPVKPTCTHDCGTYTDESSNSDDQSTSSSSTCRTATSTDCYTRSSSTVCNAYIGCECRTMTVTDAYVSCNEQSCTTTSTQAVTGCYVTATSTTVGDYCPTSTSIDPSTYDDGSDGSPDGSSTSFGTYVTATYPPTLVQSGTQYPMPSDGTVNYDGTTLVATGSAKVTTTVGSGTSVTLLPSFSGISYSITESGVSLIPPSTLTPPWEQSTSPSTPTTSSPPTSTPTEITGELVLIGWSYNVEAQSNGIEPPLVLNYWEWNMANNTNYNDTNTYKTVCLDAVYRDVDSDPNKGLYNSGFPPSMKLPANTELYGHSGCQYIQHSLSGAGSIDCDDNYGFDCVVDPESDIVVSCFDGPSIFSKYVPRIACKAPGS